MVIKRAEDLVYLEEFIKTQPLLSFDTETSGLNPRKDVVIGFSMSNQSTSFYVVHLAWDGEQLVEIVPKAACASILRSLLNTKIVTWNASFDVRFVHSYFNIDLLPCLHSDAMLALHTLNEEGPFDLKGNAALEFGSDSKLEQTELKESLQSAGAGAKEFYKADVNVLAKYARQDAILTFKLNQLYAERLEAQGLTKFFLEEEVMPLYREVTIPMERNGVPVNVPLLKEAHKEISDELLTRERSILEQMRPYLRDFETRFLNKEYPVSYTGNFAKTAARLTGAKLPLTASGQPSLAKKAIESLPNWHIFKQFMEGRINLPPDLIRKVQESLHGGPPNFNLHSKDQLRYLFFSILKETPTSFTDKGVPQVNEEFLERLRTKYNFVDELIVFNKLSKIRATYIERFLDAQEDGIFYPSFQQHRTTSGRFGGDLQQLPKFLTEEDESSEVVRKYTNLVRNFFIAGPGHKFVDADYSSLEVVVFADDAGDQALLDTINKNLDFYSVVAIGVHNLQDQYSADKKSENFLKKHKPHLRQSAKVYGLGIRYGMGDWKLSKTLNIPIEEAAQIIERYFAAYPGLKSKMDQYTEQALSLGYVQSKAGRVRHLPGAVQIVNDWGRDILDMRTLYKKYGNYKGLLEDAKRARRKLNNIINNALNFPIQSLAASIVNRASIALARAMKEKNLQSYICMNVHDELCVRCPESEVETVCSLMKPIMENTTKLSAPLTADPQVGYTYGEVK
jgi:DNA polymerase I-like protein with 3'-5' exonuclease and polymerase domains